MVALLCFFLTLLASQVEEPAAENAALRHQVIVLNHALHMAATDLFVVPTIDFGLLYVLVIVRLAVESLSGSM
jgi:hypothetical protein